MKTGLFLATGLVSIALTGCAGGSDPAVLTCAAARIASGPADLVSGPIARGTVGDFVLENGKLRAIVQKGGRNWYNISQFGGNLIDALPKAANGALLGADQFEEFALATNIESVPNYQVVKVLNPGGENPDGSCAPAIIRAEGFDGAGAPDDLMDFVNGSSAIRSLSIGGVPLQFPPGADDVDLPLTFKTDYTLESGSPYIRIDTQMINGTGSNVKIYLTEFINGSGEIEVFQHGYGFGEAFATAPCDRCNYIAFAGHEGGSGVSYGVIHKEAGSSSVSVSGVSVILYGRDIFTVATTPEASQADSPTAGPNYTVPANSTFTFTRYFAVGDGTVASIVDVRNQILAYPTGVIEGTVADAGGAPVPGAEIAMTSAQRDGFASNRGSTINVVDHFRTDAQGRFHGTYPPGTYTLEVNVPGRLAATPATASVTLSAGQVTTQDFAVPRASALRVLVRDNNGAAIPAKVHMVGARLGPDGNEPRNQDQLIAGNQLSIFTGVFGDNGADPLPPGIALAEFAVLDDGDGAVTLGDTGALPMEPGTYQLSVSHGPRYSHYTQAVTVTEGQTTTINATLAQVMTTPNHIYADFHVHSINSPDSEVTNRERVATYLAEDMDFFTPSDHDIRVDFAPVVADMGVAARLATAPSAEVTTFDYGHFNFWPVAIETDRPCDDFIQMFGGTCDTSGHSGAAKIGHGATDWGGQAPLGQDFPSAGHYSVTPGEIFDSAAQDPNAQGRTVVRQINHVDTHFGVPGLQINTGTVGTSAPQSGVAPRSKRLDPGLANHYSDAYDSLELLIGDQLKAQNTVFYQENAGDWFNLLNKGMVHTGISNSDTHQRRVTSLHTRNVISVPPSLLSNGSANPVAISADPHTVGDSVRAGRTSMSTAPFLRVKAVKNGNSAGLEVSDIFGRRSNPLPTADGAITLSIDVDSPGWAPYDQILVFVNGETLRHTNANTGVATSPPRYKICGPSQTLNLAGAGFVRDEVQVVAGNSAAKKFTTHLEVPVSHPASDYWVVVMVRGTQGKSTTLFPIVPNDFAGGVDNTVGTADDIGVRALAVSNPIFIDVNGGGWTAPGTLTHVGNPSPPAPPVPDNCPVAMPAP